MGKHDKPKGDTAKTGSAKRGPGRPPIEGPTARQREILEFTRAASQAGKRPPSIDEIRLHLKFQSTFAVRTHLQALERKGLLRIARNSHRGISLPEDDRAARTASRLVPLLGEARAGNPTEAMETICPSSEQWRESSERTDGRPMETATLLTLRIPAFEAATRSSDVQV